MIDMDNYRIQRRVAMGLLHDIQEHFSYQDAESFARNAYPVLDAGCGDGRNTDYMLRTGLDARGIDKNPEHLRLAKDRYLELRHVVVQGDVRELRYEDGMFGAVYSGSVLFGLENQEDVRKAIREARRVLVKGGYFFGRTLSNSYDQEKRHKLLMVNSDDEEVASLLRHDRKITSGIYPTFSRDLFEQVLTDSGFGSVRVDEHGSDSEMDPRFWLIFSGRAKI